MKLSTVIVTFNRHQLLNDCIESFFQMENLNSYDLELIVIDNNSNDQTLQTINTLNIKFKNKIKYFMEPKSGVSNARNLGLEKASGDYIALVDDDIYFAKAWLTETYSGILNNPSIRAFGGKITVRFENDLPKWLTTERLKHFRYGATNFGDQPKMLSLPQYPQGSSIIFRRDLVDSGLRFSPRLGRQGSNLLSNEEKSLFISLFKKGEPIFYIHGSEIIHRVAEDKTTRWWLLKRFYWQGRSEIVMNIELGLIKKDEWWHTFLHAFRNFPKKAFSFRLEDILIQTQAMGMVNQLLICRFDWPE